MFLSGKTFSSGQLTTDKWRQHTYDIAFFLTTPEYLNELMDFDPE